MEYGGVDKRRTKKDLKRKRKARGYKRGGKFRTHDINEEQPSQKTKKKTKKKKK